MRKTLALLAVLFLLLLSGCGAEKQAATEPNGEVTTNNSVQNPEGIIAKDISVPDVVLAAAQAFVKQEYDFWLSTGPVVHEDGTEKMQLDQATYDNWKIEKIERCYHYDNLEGRNLDLYRLNYRIHTTTPDKVTLTGPMEIDPEGWVLTTYPNCTYLVFSLDEAQNPTYLFPLMENDSQPGNELFTSDLLNALKVGVPGGLA